MILNKAAIYKDAFRKCLFLPLLLLGLASPVLVWALLCVPILFVLLTVLLLIPLCIGTVRYISVRRNRFFLVKCRCRGERTETVTVDIQEVTAEYMSFGKYGEYMLKTGFSEVMTVGEYYWLVIARNKIVSFYSAGRYEPDAEEFYRTENKHYVCR